MGSVVATVVGASSDAVARVGGGVVVAFVLGSGGGGLPTLFDCRGADDRVVAGAAADGCGLPAPGVAAGGGSPSGATCVVAAGGPSGEPNVTQPITAQSAA